MKTVLAIVGAVTVAFMLLGSIGVGQFFYIYNLDPQKWECKERQKSAMTSR